MLSQHKKKRHLVNPTQELWSETPHQAEIFLLLLRQPSEKLLSTLRSPEVSQGNVVPRKHHCFEPGGGPNHIVDVHLMHQGRFHNVTTSRLIFPTWPDR